MAYAKAHIDSIANSGWFYYNYATMRWGIYGNLKVYYITKSVSAVLNDNYGNIIVSTGTLNVPTTLTFVYSSPSGICKTRGTTNPDYECSVNFFDSGLTSYFVIFAMY